LPAVFKGPTYKIDPTAAAVLPHDLEPPLQCSSHAAAQLAGFVASPFAIRCTELCKALPAPLGVFLASYFGFALLKDGEWVEYCTRTNVAKPPFICPGAW
jgi:hypothetical protein